MATKTVTEEHRPTEPELNANDTFLQGVMRQKHIDHVASHSNLINQFLHLVSSSMFLYCYAILFNDYESAVYIGIASLLIRQAGHYIFEPPCHDEEQAMLGFDTRNKVRICISYGLVPFAFMAAVARNYDISLAQMLLTLTFVIVFGRVLLLWHRYGFVVSMHWYVKFITDPFTDMPAYWRSAYQVFSPTLLQGAMHQSFPETFSEPKGYVKPMSGYDKMEKIKAH
mmetsp:Transcript_12430/g.15416  ORF Transcript_12430/g.15416 Transcript_12430/m.15416 type:complete len:226 (+) Transcript_12430:151-828(+)|eukprot:CAMPEP_0204832510 /NCGR_PEP_ID=MMETSP1346-20131115/13942_1 /ASSEMBLY_ACC=CAM_ASM_000771 /TAXON_ID=215587 /ORGANISM="Aplanochytrium stocchinoi, Strain GSBS06" /LENGTH=225 /DNA_ID=CAMNT_0051964361 /DNA_START=55 /DNA_END=732 /DNA_ORIENTATION=+